jgi:hypothetical protein
MIKYGDLVQYIKDNHVSWNTDLFDVLRGFFESQSQQYPTSLPPTTVSSVSPNSSLSQPIQQELFFPTEEFKEPIDGEYTTQDLLNLLST